MKKKVLIFIVSYNAEHFIEGVLNRIPKEIWNNPDFDAEVLIIDDQSSDQTFYRAADYAQRNSELPIRVLYNVKNQGYGGNQKIGYYYAIQNGFDAVVLLHGDGQYTPEYLGQMIDPILEGEADVVFGSRMINKLDALQGKMPLYKWVGNQVLTFLQNRILNTHLSEFHTGYRAYSVAALKSVPFMYNSNYFDFDTDIIIQLLDTGNRIKEISIPTFYGDEISRVDGMRYAALILRTSILSRIMRWGIFYHPKFDYEQTNTHYSLKIGFPSSHQFALSRVRPDSTVLDVGCGPGFMSQELAKRGAKTISIDYYIQPLAEQYSVKTIQSDIDEYDFDGDDHSVDSILMLDIIEHLRSPEVVLQRIRERYSPDNPKLILTTGNIAFFSNRLGLLLGQFNYGKRGILDLDHTRLFTFYSLRNILVNNGYDILEVKGIPAPFPLALGNNVVSQLLLRANYFLICISKALFSYQIAIVARPRPTLTHLLRNAEEASQKKLVTSNRS